MTSLVLVLNEMVLVLVLVLEVLRSSTSTSTKKLAELDSEEQRVWELSRQTPLAEADPPKQNQQTKKRLMPCDTIRW